MSGYNRALPEGGINIFVDGVTKDFVFRSIGPIVIHPIYWNTSQTNTLGVCYLDAAGVMQHIPVYSNYHSDTFDELSNLVGLVDFKDEYVKIHKIDDIFKSEVVKNFLRDRVLSNGKTFSQLENNKEDFLSLLNSILPREYMQILNGYGIQNIKTAIKVNNQILGGHTITDGYWNSGYVEITYITDDAWYDETKPIEGVGGGNSVSLNVWDSKKAVLSKGVIVDVPVGMRFGMYMERGDGTKFYSLAQYNPDSRLVRDDEGKAVKWPTYMEPRQGAYHAATWVGPKFGWTWLAFEDCLTSEEANNVDFNDMVFIIENAVSDDKPPVEIVDPDPDPDPEPKPIRWLIACEDLGILDDFDFNDVVFEIEHVSGKKTATIYPLASGGTFPIWVMRELEDGSASWESPEWHSLFGKDSSTPVNVGLSEGTAEPITINVPEDFTLTSSNAGAGYRKNMGGFYLKVEREQGTITDVTPPGDGEAPQMILIYQGADEKWNWPRERSHITLGYPKFMEWSNPDNGFSIEPDGINWWHSIGQKEHLYQRK